jgi:hypothetical protein
LIAAPVPRFARREKPLAAAAAPSTHGSRVSGNWMTMPEDGGTLCEWMIVTVPSVAGSFFAAAPTAARRSRTAAGVTTVPTALAAVTMVSWTMTGTSVALTPENSRLY